MDFLVARDDLHNCRFEDAPAPEPGPGEALLRVDAFGLTSNNITYEPLAFRNWAAVPPDITTPAASRAGGS